MAIDDRPKPMSLPINNPAQLNLYNQLYVAASQCCILLVMCNFVWALNRQILKSQAGSYLQQKNLFFQCLCLKKGIQLSDCRIEDGLTTDFKRFEVDLSKDLLNKPSHSIHTQLMKNEKYFIYVLQKVESKAHIFLGGNKNLSIFHFFQVKLNE